MHSKSHQAPLVLMTDFGLRDGAVAAMKGVALGVEPGLAVHDLTHEIPPFNIWEGAYRLRQTLGYWPAGTVFVVVVDPGVGTPRRSLAARAQTGQVLVCPDNGLLTWVEREVGLREVRGIDESLHRLPGSSESYTFLGRDLYAFVGARLAAGQLTLEEVGERLDSVARLELSPARWDNQWIFGHIPVLDVQFGNVWTNIERRLLEGAGLGLGDWVEAVIRHNGHERYRETIPYVRSFGLVPQGERLLYVNSLLQASIAMNCASFAHEYRISSGHGWTVELRKASQR